MKPEIELHQNALKMPIETALGLIALAALFGYLAGLNRAKKYLQDETERLTDEIFNTLRDNDKTRMQ